jgi:hypothetical protein
MSGVISYPIPPYSNVPIYPQWYAPRSYFISAITLGVTTTITTTVSQDYVIGQLVRLVIPPTFGTRELNGQSGYVISIPASNQVVISINSVGYTPFQTSSATTLPQILPIGDVNTGVINDSGRSSVGTYIPGAFIDISPS